jgi:acetoin utilization protein AcuB
MPEVDMEVRRWMTHPVHAVKPLDSIQHARELMEKHRVNQLPVVVDGRLVGIITDRDLRDAFPSVFDSPLFGRRKPKVTTTDPRAVTVEMVMTANVTTVSPDAPMSDAVRLMQTQRIGALPVVEGERLVGILTRSDILDGYLDLAAIEERREASLFSDEPPPATPASRRAKPVPRAPHRRRRFA